MILDRFENAKLYRGIHPGIDKILEKVQEYSPENFPENKLVLKEDCVFLLPNTYVTHSPENASFEAHKAFIDVMCMIEGEETIYVKNTDQLSQIKKEYDPVNDYLLGFFDEDRTDILLKEGFFCILFPQDAHAPGCNTKKTNKVKKFVGKVRIKENFEI